jgi:hypothetical protein
MSRLTRAWHLWWPFLGLLALVAIGCALDPGQGMP